MHRYIQTLHKDCSHIEDVHQRRRSGAEFSLVLLTVPRWCFFCQSFFVFNACNILACLFLSILWSLAGKGLTTWLSCVWCFLVFLSFFFMVSRIRCGTWFYLFLIFAFFTLIHQSVSHLLEHWTRDQDVAVWNPNASARSCVCFRNATGWADWQSVRHHSYVHCNLKHLW